MKTTKLSSCRFMLKKAQDRIQFLALVLVSRRLHSQNHLIQLVLI